MEYQQFKIMVEDASKIEIGGIVYDNGTDDIIGFVSYTDNISIIEMTLFSPHDEIHMPKICFDKLETVDFKSIFERCKLLMRDNILEYWENGEILEVEFTSNQ